MQGASFFRVSQGFTLTERTAFILQPPELPELINQLIDEYSLLVLGPAVLILALGGLTPTCEPLESNAVGSLETSIYCLGSTKRQKTLTHDLLAITYHIIPNTYFK